MHKHEEAGAAGWVSRRGAFGLIAAGTVGTLLGGCARPAGDAGEVVLYSSVDDYILREVVDAFQRESGVTVRLLGDTEATKTTGLIERLIAERDAPRADVWWSSEPFGTIRLGGLGLFEPSGLTPPPATDPALAGRLDAPDGSWFGFALRARVIAVREGRFGAGQTPDTLGVLTEAGFRGRVGMARPRFGTTRGHMAALAATYGEPALRRWLSAMAANGLRLYDGNSTVVRAIAEAEIDVGLTDTDDAWTARRNGWPVAAVFERAVERPVTPPHANGPLLIPNTVARVRGGPNPAQAGALMGYLLAGPAEQMLEASDSHNIPVRCAASAEAAAYAVPGGWLPDLARVAAADGVAMRVCDEVLGEG